MTLFPNKQEIPSPQEALPGREEPVPVSETHYVSDNRIVPPFPEGMELAIFGMGCFWGAERRYWQTGGVYSTMVGYAGGYTRNPTYREVCSGKTAHAEVVRIVYDTKRISYEDLLRLFWEGHDPTQGMRQGNDIGTQYRSAIYTHSETQMRLAQQSCERYQAALKEAGYGSITTEIREAPPFYYAEDYHQQYLAKNPSGYCGLGGIDVPYPVPQPGL
ncbi:peptide-methionine (S)-S-oxide reductase MsrA [Thiohalomonas denitrificans]|uniref:Peptide methionine sulfoxide reductase MsrA n=1 Tax=Thiohalomonas denitrificans TaxID=415747 RepID=A0A1G5PT05_9GAMM|nr:peptide-methionine (S)-S-oxide reductase MsrA [Thiohalomonas denitrificans]SCZ52694.1 peptide-methionine (S)-S-oxide reductase [Thiohalomonas denitrificans]